MSPPPRVIDPAKLEEQREAIGRTRLQVAAATPYGVRTLYSWERGTREPTPENLLTLASHYGVNPDALLIRPRDSWLLIDARYARGLRIADVAAELRAVGCAASRAHLSTIEKGAQSAGDLTTHYAGVLHLSVADFAAAWERSRAFLLSTV